ncbi:MAG TPA: DUF202 domain-containing protein [Sphingomicrobium sp.]|nr:DUF202 domain-containing protein [Sphingomicrobium sp.]
MTDDVDDQPDSGSRAARRTELAEDRTILASERTFAGWVRTSLGCIAIGLGFHALFNKMEPTWLPKTIATGFLLLAILIIWLAERRAAAVLERMDTHVVVSARRMNLRWIAGAVSVGSATLVAAMWLVGV